MPALRRSWPIAPAALNVAGREVGHYIPPTPTATPASEHNYERAAGSSTLLAQTHVKITKVVESGLGGLDYAILRLEGRPGDKFGITAVAFADASIGNAITIISHPNGVPQQVEGGNVSARSTTKLQYNNLDTLEGSSGAGILNSNGAIVGVHTNGGCTRTGGANSGVRISKIRAASNIL